VKGRTLGHYPVLDTLGSGGMGEVYKAWDTRLNRLVAIKVLRNDLAANASRIQRFIQEARSASALNHPNIVTVYQVEFVSEGTSMGASSTTPEIEFEAPGMGNYKWRVWAILSDGLRSAASSWRSITYLQYRPCNLQSRCAEL